MTNVIIFNTVINVSFLLWLLWYLVLRRISIETNRTIFYGSFCGWTVWMNYFNSNCGRSIIRIKIRDEYKLHEKELKEYNFRNGCHPQKERTKKGYLKKSR